MSTLIEPTPTLPPALPNSDTRPEPPVEEAPARDAVLDATAGKPGVAGLNVETVEGAKVPLTPDEAVIILQQLVWESYQARTQRWPALEEMLQRNYRMFVGDQWDELPPGIVPVTLNFTQQVCLEVAHLLTENPLRPKLSARCDGGPCRYVLTMAGMAKAAQVQAPGADGSLFDKSGLDQLTAALLQVNAPLGPDDFKEITVDASRDAGQKVYNDKWEKAGADMTVDTMTLGAAVMGFSCMWVREDPDNWGIQIEPVHPLQAYPDPGHPLEIHFDSVVCDNVIALDKAVHIWPLYEEDLRRLALDGSTPLQALGTLGGDVNAGFLTNQITWQKKNCPIRLGYLKHQEYPATEQEAVRRGLVKWAPNGGGYTLPTGEATAAGQDNWPVVRDGLREVLVLCTKTLRDRRCLFPDIPLIWTVCRPDPYQPWGQGYSQLIHDANVTINMVVTIIKAHIGYYQSPSEDMPESVYKLMKDDEGRSIEGTTAGMRMKIPDDLWRDFKGEVRKFHVPPPMSEAMFKFAQWLVTMMKELADNVDVASGQQPPNTRAAEQLEMLVQNARGVFSMLARHTEQAVRRIGDLLLHLIQSGWVPESEWGRILANEEPQVVRAYRTVFMQTAWQTNVEAMAGSLQRRKQKEADAERRYADGLDTLESTLGKIGETAPKQKADEIMRAKQGAENPDPKTV